MVPAADIVGRLAAHAAAGCASSAAGGGNCGAGAVSAVFGKFTTTELTANIQNDIASAGFQDKPADRKATGQFIANVGTAVAAGGMVMPNPTVTSIGTGLGAYGAALSFSADPSLSNALGVGIAVTPIRTPGRFGDSMGLAMDGLGRIPFNPGSAHLSDVVAP